MSDLPVRIVLDTNIWIDNYCGWHAKFAACKKLLSTVGLSEGFELYFPVHAMQDVLYVVASEYKRKTRLLKGELTESEALAAQEVALGCARNMCELATPVGADGSDLWLADKYLSIHHDFEDNLVLAACKRIKADYLVTSERKLIEHADVLAKTPEDMVKLIEIGRISKQGAGLSPDDVSWRFRS